MRLAPAALVLACALPAAAAGPLRVCADPDNLPFSHADGSGFENRIAGLLAADMGRSLEYAWLPDRRGFVRKTLGEGLCDLIIGVPVGFERVATTTPYYRSSYVWLERQDARHAPRGWNDPAMKRLRIGVQLVGDDHAATPPGHALMQHGLVRQVTGFPIAGEEPAAQRMVRAMAEGRLDAAALWGPQAGWFAARSPVPLRWRILPAPQLPGQRFEFDIAMGVRHGDKALRAQLDETIVRRRSDIERILHEYAVPLLPLAPREAR